ncbi:MAG: ABC transporter ATP-binding protein [Candidatus Izemoplasmataceae bacterium]
MLSLHNLDIGYDVKKPVIENLSTTIETGKITVIIGPNGCGKSTLLKAVTRVMKPSKGDVILDGKNLATMPTRTIAKEMAFLPQSHDKATGLTVYELVSYGRYPYQKGLGRLTHEDRRQIEWALNATGIESIRDRLMDTLSGGQKQRAWIAMALVQDTDIIFLDEPTTYLDIAHQLEILHLLKTLNQKNHQTIVMVLHDINQAATYADSIIALKDGVIEYSGSVHEVITKDIIREVFQVEVDIFKDAKANRPIIYNYRKR